MVPSVMYNKLKVELGEMIKVYGVKNSVSSPSLSLRLLNLKINRVQGKITLMIIKIIICILVLE